MTRRTLAAVVALAAAAPAPALAQSEPELVARAILPADATAPAPFPGVRDTEPAPAPGARQPVGGFSALLDAPGRDTFYAMPDNGFGTKANSASFLLRVYRVRADFETRRGGDGDVEIRDWITLSDPADKVPFPIVTEGSSDRLLTGGDFDPESMRIARDGTLWFGDEFGPFLLHTDARGRVLEAPIALPDGVRSPDAEPPYTLPPTLARSNGFEGMAISPNGRTLYPALEGPVAGEDPTVRRVYEFDIRKRRWSSAVRQYRVADPSYLLSDLSALDKRRFVTLERDNFEGPAAQHKRAFVYDLRTGAKREVLDQLDIADPDLISLPGRPGDFGLGDPFKMPYQTIESVLPVGAGRLAIVNDTNFGSRGRNPTLDDYSDFIVVDVPGLGGGDDDSDDD
jgi:glycerophosphoryl diester phosphodiesterase